MDTSNKNKTAVIEIKEIECTTHTILNTRYTEKSLT